MVRIPIAIPKFLTGAGEPRPWTCIAKDESWARCWRSGGWGQLAPIWQMRGGVSRISGISWFVGNFIWKTPLPSFSRSAAFEKRCGEPNVRRQIVVQWYMLIPVPLTSSMGATMFQELSIIVSLWFLGWWLYIKCIYYCHPFLPCPHTYTHIVKQLCLCCFSRLHKMFACGEFSGGRESHSTPSKEQKKQKEAEEARKDRALEMEVYFLELHHASEYRYACLSKSQCHARNSNGMRKRMLSLYQSFPSGFMTLQRGDFPPQISLGKEKERDKTGGLGGHWVKASNFSGAPDGPTRSGIRFVAVNDCKRQKWCTFFGWVQNKSTNFDSKWKKTYAKPFWFRSSSELHSESSLGNFSIMVQVRCYRWNTLLVWVVSSSRWRCTLPFASAFFSLSLWWCFLNEIRRLSLFQPCKAPERTGSFLFFHVACTPSFCLVSLEWLYLCNGSEVHSDASSELSFDLHFEARLYDVTLWILEKDVCSPWRFQPMNLQGRSTSF